MAFRLSSSILCFLFCLTLLPQAAAQSSLFLPFGNPKEDVISYLETREYVKRLEVDQDLDVVRITLNPRKKVEYAFYKNRLYAVTILQNYTKGDQAKEAEDHLMEYLRSTGAPDIQKKGEEPMVCYTAITDSRVLKVFARTHDQSRSLILSSISLAHGPDMSEADMFYETRFFNFDQNNNFVLDDQ